jgi:hypothetical protein
MSHERLYTSNLECELFLFLSNEKKWLKSKEKVVLNGLSFDEF